MFDFVPSSYPWLWALAGLCLMVIEMMVPGAFFLWVGIAALIVGAVSFLIPFTLSGQFLLFGILAPLVTYMGKRYMKGHLISDAPLLNARSKQLIGKVIVLSHPIVGGKAQIVLGDSVWNVKGPDCPKGTSVTVISVEGNTLNVESNDV